MAHEEITAYSKGGMSKGRKGKSKTDPEKKKKYRAKRKVMEEGMKSKGIFKELYGSSNG